MNSDSSGRPTTRATVAGLALALMSCAMGSEPGDVRAPERALASTSARALTWGPVGAVATAAGQTATSLKISADAATLLFHVDGTGLGGYYNLLIDADGNPASGSQEGPWSSSGADYLIENGLLYRFERSGWTLLDSSSVTSTAGTASVDVSVAKSALAGLGSSFAVGFKDISPGWTLQSALPAAGSFAQYPKATQVAGFVVDGSAQEWAGVDPLATASGQPAASLKATFNDEYLYFVAQGTGLGGTYSLYLNTDNNPATGCASVNGADYMVQNGSLFQSTGAAWEWRELGNANVQSVANSSAVEIRVARAALGSLAATLTIQFEDVATSPQWTVQGTIPVGSFAVMSLARFGKGMIVPAYLAISSRNPTDPSYDASALAAWTVLAEAAAAFESGSSQTYKDFWVAVNSGNSGPFTQADGADAWARAASLWDPIRANGGVIFGYVHTCVGPAMPLVQQYRPLQDVKNDIAAWVRGYPALGGIWIDEFYPWYELASEDGKTLFPNGQQYSPADQSWTRDTTYWTVDVNPAGGYYDQLTKWIRTTYPNLRIIGNAGGYLRSNQRKYAALVDVTCTFEQSVAYALVDRDTGAFDWGGLKRDPYNTAPGQLALIHENSADMAGMLNLAIDKGYSHFYTTDRKYGDNLWGGLPPYFASEASSIANLK